MKCWGKAVINLAGAKEAAVMSDAEAEQGGG